MPLSDDMVGESFRGLVLQLRGRTGLTQRELAIRVGVNISSIQGWEAGANYPGVASLKALIGIGLQAYAFTTGRETEEAQALWAAALRDAPRFRTPFDHIWFERLVAGPRELVPADAEWTVAAPAAQPATARSARRESWGEAPDVAGFLNRVSERALLRQWVVDEGSRLVAMLGLGGIGKSLLATRLAHDLAPSFERIFWRSLRDAPTPGEWLAEAIRFLAPDDAREPGGEAVALRRLLELLGEVRCLLVLDNVETVLQPGGPVGGYREGYEGYGTLLRQVAEAPHRSCLVVTSREEPAELGPLRGERGPVRVLMLTGLGVEDGRALLGDKRLDGDDDAWRALIERYGGNGLALKVVGETTREMFGGSIADYLEFATATSGVMAGGVRQLLHEQMQRLSDLEHELLRRLAVEREPVSVADLAANLGPHFARAATLDAVEGLRRRSLLERTERGSSFSLHSVVLEYVTEQLIEDAAHELATGDLDRLLRQPLLKATAKDYVRRSQERLIAGPAVDRLIEACGDAGEAERRLLGLLSEQRSRPAVEQGYGPGNLVNLLRLLRGDLKGADLSGLAIRQAYLQDVEAQGASLAGAHLSEAVLGEAFRYPSSVALNADGAFLVAGTATGEICRWRVADCTLLAVQMGHTGAVWGLAVSRDGRLVASGGIDGAVRLWDMEDGRPVMTLPGHAGGVYAVALSRDGRLVASGGVDGMVRLWAWDDGRALATLQGHAGGVWGVALREDGGLVVSSGLDATVRLWDGADGRSLATLQGHTGGVHSVALSRDGRLIASGGGDGTVRLWDGVGGRPLAVLHGHDGGVARVAVSEDGRLVASSGMDGTVRLWEAEGRRSVAILQGRSSGLAAVALSRDGRLVASSGMDGAVRLWETEGGRPLAELQGQTGGFAGVALSGNGRLVASASVDGTVRLRDAASGRPLATLLGHAGGVCAAAVTANGRLVASGGLDGIVRLWDAESGRARTTLRLHTDAIQGVAFSGDGELLASGSVDGTVRVWESESGRSVAVLQGHVGAVWTVALSTDGRLVASGSFDETVRLWDTVSGTPLATLPANTGGVRSVALSGDGRLVASGGVDGTVRLWEAEGGRRLATLHGHVRGVWGVALSSDGLLAASAGDDETVRLWDTVSGRPLVTLTGHVGSVRSVALSADGRLAVSGGIDATLRFWDTFTGACLWVGQDDRRYERVDIAGLTGVTDAQRQVLLALGAVEQSGQTAPST